MRRHVVMGHVPVCGRLFVHRQLIAARPSALALELHQIFRPYWQETIVADRSLLLDEWIDSQWRPHLQQAKSNVRQVIDIVQRHQKYDVITRRHFAVESTPENAGRDCPDAEAHPDKHMLEIDVLFK